MSPMAQPLVFNVQAKQDSSCNAVTRWVAYDDFIERARRCFPANFDDSIDRGDPHFPVLDVVLRTNSHEVKLRIYRNYLRLQGYKMEGADQWLELRRGDKARRSRWYGKTWSLPDKLHEIAGSVFLVLDDKCSSSEHAMGEGRAVRNMLLGQRELTTAVNLLAVSTSSQERAWSLVVVCMMICNGIKFVRVSDFFSNTYLESLPLPLGMLEWLRSFMTDFVLCSGTFYEKCWSRQLSIPATIV